MKRQSFLGWSELGGTFRRSSSLDWVQQVSVSKHVPYVRFPNESFKYKESQGNSVHAPPNSVYTLVRSLSTFTWINISCVVPTQAQTIYLYHFCAALWYVSV